MAQDVQIIRYCDPCDKLGLERVAAVAHYTLYIAPGTPRSFALTDLRNTDVCAVHDHFLRPIVDLYNGGQRAELPEPKATKTPKAPWVAKKAVASTAPQLELPAGEPDSASAQDAADQPVAVRRGPRRKTSDKPLPPGKVHQVICPLDHKGGKGPVKMPYSNRKSHAAQVHKADQAEIVWGDPEGILTFPCTIHEVCVKTGFATSAANGLRVHQSGSRLKKIGEAGAA